MKIEHEEYSFKYRGYSKEIEFKLKDEVNRDLILDAFKDFLKAVGFQFDDGGE